MKNVLPVTDVARLEHFILGTPWLLEVLRVVRDRGPRLAHVGAGAIRDTVWDCLTGMRRSASHTATRDVDVVYFQPGVPDSEQWMQRLHAALPQHRWDITNQALVHGWQSLQLGRPIAPYASLEAAVASWPETATAIAVRLRRSERLAIVAPYGCRDLFSMQLRPSPGLTSPSVYTARLREKQWAARWTCLTVHGVAIHANPTNPDPTSHD